MPLFGWDETNIHKMSDAEWERICKRNRIKHQKDREIANISDTGSGILFMFFVIFFVLVYLFGK